MRKFYCFSCERTLVVKKDTDSVVVKCKCGELAGVVRKVGSIGRLVKASTYEDMILDGTEYRTIEEFRKGADAPNCEDLKRRMLRKYGDLAVGDDVRPNNNLADRISDSIERVQNETLDEDARAGIRNIEGTISGANIRRDTYDVDWTAESKALASRYNGDKFDFFDLAGDWNSWDLNRVITQSDVGSLGSVENEKLTNRKPGILGGSIQG